MLTEQQADRELKGSKSRAGTPFTSEGRRRFDRIDWGFSRPIRKRNSGDIGYNTLRRLKSKIITAHKINMLPTIDETLTCTEVKDVC